MSPPNEAIDHFVQEIVGVACVPLPQYSFVRVPWKSIKSVWEQWAILLQLTHIHPTQTHTRNSAHFKVTFFITAWGKGKGIKITQTRINHTSGKTRVQTSQQTYRVCLTGGGSNDRKMGLVHGSIKICYNSVGWCWFYLRTDRLTHDYIVLNTESKVTSMWSLDHCAQCTYFLPTCMYAIWDS